MKKPIVWLFVIIILLWTLLPFYAMIITSIASTGTISRLYPTGVTFEYFKTILFGTESGGRSIWPYLINSVMVCGLVTIIVLLISVPCAYGLSRWRSNNSNRIYMGFFIIRMLPPIALVVPWFFIINDLHLMDTYIGLALTYIPFQIPVGVWLMKAFFDGIPREIEESAWVEGASVLKTFQKIILPLNKNGLVVTAVFVFIYSYIEYMYASIFTRSNATTIPPYIVGFQTQFILKFQLMLAATLISMIPLAIFFLLIQRFIVKGITGGALKE